MVEPVGFTRRLGMLARSSFRRSEMPMDEEVSIRMVCKQIRKLPPVKSMEINGNEHIKMIKALFLSWRSDQRSAYRCRSIRRPNLPFIHHRRANEDGLSGPRRGCTSRSHLSTKPVGLPPCCRYVGATEACTEQIRLIPGEISSGIGPSRTKPCCTSGRILRDGELNAKELDDASTTEFGPREHRDVGMGSVDRIWIARRRVGEQTFERSWAA